MGKNISRKMRIATWSLQNQGVTNERMNWLLAIGEEAMRKELLLAALEKSYKSY